jgi:hypothetical protein
MAYSQIAEIDPLRSLAFGSISGTYAAVGIAFTHPVRVICITNNTDGDMVFSNDGITDKLFLAKGSFKLFDLNTNHDGGLNQGLKIRVGTVMYVKQVSAPTTGSVYIENIYAFGD